MEPKKSSYSSPEKMIASKTGSRPSKSDSKAHGSYYEESASKLIQLDSNETGHT